LVTACPQIILICTYASGGVTKKLPFIISEYEMVQATFWNPAIAAIAANI